MKELEPGKIDQKEVVREVHSQEVYLGPSKLQPGEKWWQLDLGTMRISEAELSDERIEMIEEVNLWGYKTGKLVPKIVKDLISKDNCTYTHAINAKNAKRKFLKRIKNASEKNRFKEAN